MKSNKRRLLSNKKLHNIYNLKSLKKHRIKQKTSLRPKHFNFKQSGGYDTFSKARNAIKPTKFLGIVVDSGHHVKNQHTRYYKYFNALIDFAEAVWGNAINNDFEGDYPANILPDETHPTSYIDKFENNINLRILYHYEQIPYNNETEKIVDQNNEHVQVLVKYKQAYNKEPDFYKNKVLMVFDKDTITNDLILKTTTISKGSKVLKGGKTSSDIFNPYKGGEEFIKETVRSGHGLRPKQEDIARKYLKYRNLDGSKIDVFNPWKGIGGKDVIEKIQDYLEELKPDEPDAVTAGKVAGECTDRVTAQNGGTLEGQLLVAVKLSELRGGNINLKCQALLDFIQTFRTPPTPAHGGQGYGGGQPLQGEQGQPGQGYGGRPVAQGAAQGGYGAAQ